MNNNTITYEGNVKIQYLVNNKPVIFKGHNEGLSPLFKYMCKLLSGNVRDAANEKPAFFDVKCIYQDSSQQEIIESCLYNYIGLSNAEYVYDTSLSTWVTRFTITLSYNMINFDIVDTNPTADIYLYILAQNGNEFARLKLETSEIQLRDIIPGTQALIEWTMVLQNK